MARREYQPPPIGEAICQSCGVMAEVRETKTAKRLLYLVCVNGTQGDNGCGMTQNWSPVAQEALRARTRFFSQGEPQGQTPEPAPAPGTDQEEKTPEKTHVPEAGRGFLGKILNAEI